MAQPSRLPRLLSLFMLTLLIVLLAAASGLTPVHSMLQSTLSSGTATLSPSPYVIIAPQTNAPTPTALPSPTVVPTDTVVPTVPATLTPTPITIWLSPAAPAPFQAAFQALTQSGRFVKSDQQAAAQVAFAPALDVPMLATPMRATWIYVPIAAFPTIPDDLSWTDVQAYWRGDPNAMADFHTADGKLPTFVATADSLALMTALLGAPAANVPTQIVNAEDVSKTLWMLRPGAWAIAPFDQLADSEKALTIDGVNALLPDSKLDDYPLAVTFTLSGKDPVLAQTIAALEPLSLPTTNRDLDKLTVLVMTGTTALTRATAYVMEQEGITLPARDILPFLADADFVHTSNELAFSPDCPYPDPSYKSSGLIFCSRESYLDLLKAIHLNVVELTGNHVNDIGTDAFSHTLDIYDQNNISTFGGGRNADKARAPLILHNHGNTIAMIGCNKAGPQTAWATDTLPGAAMCDFGYLDQELPTLRKAADVVIMTVQYDEYFTYSAPLDQVQYFQQLADLGPDFVFGSQAHQPQGFAFSKNSLIQYGSGNIFFDQMDEIATRQMFADKFIIYDGKLLNLVLFTGLSEDYSRPRPMTADERAAFLKLIFNVSGW